MTHDNPSARYQAVEKLDDQAALENFARNDADVNVRKLAVLKLTNRSVLEDIVKHADNPGVYDAAAANLAGAAIPFKKRMERELQDLWGLDFPEAHQPLDDCKRDIHDWQYDMFVPSDSGLRSRRKCMICGRTEVCGAPG